jgi:hypothetical protein
MKWAIAILAIAAVYFGYKHYNVKAELDALKPAA